MEVSIKDGIIETIPLKCKGVVLDTEEGKITITLAKGSGKYKVSIDTIKE